MKCQDAQKALMTGETAKTPGLRKHLSECAECLLFQKTLSLVLDSDYVDAPAPELDDSINAYASANCAERAKTPVPARSAVIIPILRLAAAAAIVAIAMVFWHRKEAPGNRISVAENVTAEVPSQEEWNEAELEWTVLDVQMDAALAELQGEDVSEASVVAEKESSYEASRSGLDDRLFEMELDLYFEQQALERSYRVQEQG